MSKIRGWTKLPPSEWLVKGDPVWRNMRTGQLLVVSHADRGGGVVYVQTGGQLVNAVGSGTGFRTFDLAMRWAANYRKTVK